MRIGPYVIERMLARGGMATVHEARSVESGERVALKLPILPEGAEAAQITAQLRHEVRAMARLSHPHIVPVLDWGATLDGQLYLAMPLVEDRPLREVARGLDAPALFALVDQLLDALAYAHDRGVIHRDIKPKNVLVGRRASGAPHLFLTDFGIAALEGGADELVPMGTPTFMAPEQLRADARIGPQADLYAVGALLYLLFQGARPFPGRTWDEVWQQRRERPKPTFTNDAIRVIPEGLEAIVHRLLDDDPLLRYPSASSLRAALAPLASHAGGRAATRDVCLECGERLPAGAIECPLCDEAGLTVADSAPSQVRDDASRTPEERAVPALAFRADPARRTAVAALLERANAQIRWEANGAGVATLPAAGAGEAAEIALELGALTGARVGLGWATAQVSEGQVVAVQADAARALASEAGEGEVRVEEPLGRELVSSHAVRVDGGSWLIVAPQARVSSGRTGEARLRPLLEIAAEVKSARRARGVTLVARAGTGRSSALEELAARLEADGWSVVAATAVATDRADPFSRIGAALRAWAGIWPGADRAEVARELTALAGDSLAAAAASALVPLPDEAPGARARATDAIGGLLSAAAAQRSLLLSIDDAEHLDDASRALCAVLLERMRELPFLLVLSQREGTEISTGTPALALGPLPEADARAMLDARLPALTAKNAQAMVRLAGGHPGRLEELVRLVEERGPLALPDSLPDSHTDAGAALAQVRLDALDEVSLSVARLAAVVGSPFVPAQLLDIAPPELRSHVLLSIAKLANAKVIGGARGAGPRALRFTSEPLRELARASVPKEEARAIHAACARWLERSGGRDGAGSDTIAHHWREAGDAGRAAAFEVRAARRLEALGSIAEACARYRAALSTLDRDGPVRSSIDRDGAPLPVDVPDLLASLAHAALEHGEPELARSAAERALAVDEPPRAIVRGRARTTLAELARVASDPEAALAHLDAALTELGDRGDPILRAQLLGRRGFILGYVLGHNEAGRASSEEALRVIDGLDVPGVESHLYSELGANELRAGRWDRQLACNERALQLATEAQELSGRVRAHINLGVCFTNRGRLDDAAHHAIEAASIALRTGMHRARVIALNNLGLVRLDQGELEEARRLFEEVLELARRHGVGEVLYETLPSLGRVLLALGESGTALAKCREGAEISQREGNPVGVALAWRTEALVLAGTDRPGALASTERALTALGEALDAYERAVTALLRASLLGESLEPIGAVLTALGASFELERRRWTV